MFCTYHVKILTTNNTSHHNSPRHLVCASLMQICVFSQSQTSLSRDCRSCALEAGARRTSCCSCTTTTGLSWSSWFRIKPMQGNTVNTRTCQMIRPWHFTTCFGLMSFYKTHDLNHRSHWCKLIKHVPFIHNPGAGGDVTCPQGPVRGPSWSPSWREYGTGFWGQWYLVFLGPGILFHDIYST